MTWNFFAVLCGLAPLRESLCVHKRPKSGPVELGMVPAKPQSRKGPQRQVFPSRQNLVTSSSRRAFSSVLVAVFSDNCLESIDPRSPVREDSLGEIVERTGYLIRFHFFIRDRREMPVELQFCRAEIARCNVPANDVGSKNAEPFLSEREQPIR